MTHTPGPWFTKKDNPLHVRCHAGRISYPSATQICAVRPYPHTPEARAEARANARLIAAAPAMLEALRIITTNAKVQPDASMEGATDIYAVPLDDIDTALALLETLK